MPWDARRFLGAVWVTASCASAAGVSPTFHKQIAPILYGHCASCHRPGEAAPFSLLTYADAKKHARQIAEVTRTRTMPPWLPEPQELKFADEMRLSETQIDLLQKWVDLGAAEGN